MSRAATRLPALAAAALFVSVAAWAQSPPAPPTAVTPGGLPEALRGAWYAGDCAAPEGLAVVTARSVALLPADDTARLFRFHATRALAGWTLGTADGAEAPRLLLRRAGAALELVEPDPKTRDDRLPGEIAPETWQRCPAPPLGLMLLHGEGVALLAALERMEAGCDRAEVTLCAEAIVAQADVSGDTRLSVAELARLVRGAAWLVAVQDGATPDGILAATGAGGLAGVLAARLLIDSLDYDGDGSLSAAELAQDRLGIGGAPGSPFGDAAGSPLPLAGIAEGAGLLRGLVEGLSGGQ